MHIVIVDNEPTIAKGISTIIQKMEKQYIQTIQWFYEAAKAMDYLENHPVDLIFTDIQMTTVSGLEFMDMVKKRWNSIYFIVISGFDMYDYVNSAYQIGAVDYLLKPISKEKLSALLDAVQQKLVESRRQFMQDALGNLLEGSEKTYWNFIEQNPDWLGSAIPSGCHFALALPDLKPSETVRLPDILKKHLRFPVHILCVRGGILPVYLITIPQREQLPELETLLSKEFPHAQGGISSLSTDTHVARSLYVEAIQATKYRMFYPPNSLIHADQASAGRQTAYPELLKTCDDLIKFCAAPNPQKLQEQILTLFSRENLNKYSVSAIEQLCSTLHNSLGTLYQEKELSLPELPALVSFRRPEGLTDYMLALFLAVTPKNSGDFYTEIRDKVSSYIEKHYMDNLTLATVSNHVSMSYNYFSKLFHSLFSIGFSDYLNKIRMEHAKDLLQHSGLSVSEISQKTGYSSPKHFSRTFKRFFGRSPADFRK